jgi:hypothetical protein
MDPLTYVVAEGSCDDEAQLLPCPRADISERMWEDLAAHIAAQRTQIPVPAAILSRRCQEGYAAVVISGDCIAAYSSLSPIAEGASSLHSWSAITVHLDLPDLALPDTRLYEFASSWTDPSWRCKHINMSLRRLLTSRFLGSSNRAGVNDSALALGGMIRLTSSALARLGCRIMAWNAAPFVTSLIAVPAADFPEEAAIGWRPPEGLALYQGPDVLLDDPSHRWEQFIHCWVTDSELAIEVDWQLAALLRGDLRRWRSAIVTTFTRPSSLHRLAFLPPSSGT